ncbi:MAG: glycosyltransferase family 2 protein, partial [Thermodesulfobacteriota bacterium]
FLRWDTMGVKPFLRNKQISKFDYNYIETDYVAICSALIRYSALKATGLMDERYFIFWDDMDLGLRFKKAGLKVVAVPGSIVFHPSFTERKRGIATDYYYGLRNPLLVYSKHTPNFLRLKIFHTFFRNYFRFLMLLLLNQRWNNLKFASAAIYDFVFNNWGKCKLDVTKNIKSETTSLSDIKLKSKKALIIFDSYNDNGLEILKSIKESVHNIEIYALIDEDRKDLYDSSFNEIISVNVERRKTSLLYNFSVFLKILRCSFDFSVGSDATPYGYATGNYYIFNNGFFEKTDIRISSSYKVIIAAFLGELISLILTPIVFISSFKYIKQGYE